MYRQLKHFGSDNLALTDDDDFAWNDVDESTTEFLTQVWNTCGPIAAWKLRNMTHAAGPWKRHFAPDERFIVIPQDEIREYFAGLEPAAS